ncbi:MFS general substrate transporter [Panus rudis PR-1116 ss-1]|nr:MFS general substrate transporter [Panus rudis PR-1116 ss-1]
MTSPQSSRNSISLSRTTTLVNETGPRHYSSFRKYTLLGIFCLAQFLDAFNNCALFSALPTLVRELSMTESESTWLISAFQLTFAAFLLVSGRVSDIYSPKYTFITGIATLGILSLVSGFARQKIALIILRALTGVAASFTIPSALALIVALFGQKKEQTHALATFAASGAIGNVLGLTIGALFVQFTTWNWVFWFVACVAIPISLTCFVLIPGELDRHAKDKEFPDRKWRCLDLVGVSILTVALILFIFAVTSASAYGWASVMVLPPLFISVLIIVAFFYYETRIPPEVASVPPNIWWLPNFAVLFGVSLFPYFWWTTVFTIFTNLWQNVYHWSVIESALRMIPLGACSFLTSFSGPLARNISTKWLIITGMSLATISTVLFHFADGPDKYLPFVLPAFMLGATGCMLTFTHTNIAIFQTAPAAMAGTIGAIFNAALQLGSAVGISAVTSIQSTIESKRGGSTSYSGRGAAFWFVVGIAGAEIIAMSIFFHRSSERRVKEEMLKAEETEKPGQSASPSGPEPLTNNGRHTRMEDRVPPVQLLYPLKPCLCKISFW